MKAFVSVDMEGVSGPTDPDEMRAACAEARDLLGVCSAIAGEVGCTGGQYG